MVRLFDSITHYLFDLIFNNQYLIYMLKWFHSLFHLSVDANSRNKTRLQKLEKNSMKLPKDKYHFINLKFKEKKILPPEELYDLYEEMQSPIEKDVVIRAKIDRKNLKTIGNQFGRQNKKQNGHVSNSICTGQEIEQYTKEPKIFLTNKNLSQSHNLVEKRKIFGKTSTSTLPNQINGNGHKMSTNEKTHKILSNQKIATPSTNNGVDDKGIGDRNEFDSAEKNGIKIGSYSQINRHGSISKVSDLILSHNNKIASVKGQPKIVLTNTANSARQLRKKTPTPEGDKAASNLTHSALKHFDDKAKKNELLPTTSINSSTPYEGNSIENMNGHIKNKVNNATKIDDSKLKETLKPISPLNVTNIFDDRPIKTNACYPDFDPPNLQNLLNKEKCMDIPIIREYEFINNDQYSTTDLTESQNNYAKSKKTGPLLLRKSETHTEQESIDEDSNHPEKPFYNCTNGMTLNTEINISNPSNTKTNKDSIDTYLGSQDVTFSVDNLKRRLASREPLTSLYLEGRKRLVIIVTGGTRGLGLAIVRKFCRLIYGFEQESFNFDERASNPAEIAQCRFDIVITGRDDRQGAKLVSDLQYKLESALRNRDRTKGGGNGSYPLPQVSLTFQHLDVTDGESITTFTNHIARNYGGVDVLINNAATCAEVTNSSLPSFQRFESNGGVRRSYRREAIKKTPLPALDYGPLYEKVDDEGEDDDKRDVIFGETFYDKMDSSPSSPQDCDISPMLNDYDIAEITLRTNFWGLVNLYSSLFPIFRPHCRVVNITCSAGSPRNSVRPEIRTKLLKTVNHESQNSTQNNLINAGGHTKGGSSSWFSSSYFNINIGKQDKNAIKDETNSKVQSNSSNVIRSYEELEDLMESYLKATKEGLRAKEGWSGSHYSISKMGVTVLTAVLQQAIDQCDQGNENDIIINTCCPGYIKTSMNGHKGNISVDEGCETPVYLALLPPNAQSPRGNLVCQKRIKEWR